MTDTLTSEQRSYNMSRIRGKDTGPELLLRRRLKERGIKGYRVKNNLPGKPDIVFSKHKIAIFIDGCFWHKCPVDFKEPATNKEFWFKKIEGNVERDRKTDTRLLSMGWTVLRFWEHEVEKEPDNVVCIIIERLNSAPNY